MNPTRILSAAAAVNQTPLDWLGNQRRILQVLDQAKEQNIQVVCLPELCLTGYGCEDAFFYPETWEQAWQSLQEIIPHTHQMVVTLGMPLSYQHKLYNAVAVVADRRLVGFVCKQHLPNYGVFYEDRWFHRWPAGVRAEIERDGISYPIGDLSFLVGHIHLGLEICEDAWVPNRPGKALYERGIDLILNPSASPFTFDKFRTRERLVQDASRTFGCGYVYTNLLGNEAGRLIFDGDAMIASSGELLASSTRFSYADFTLTTAWIDVEVNSSFQTWVKSPVTPTQNTIKLDFEWNEVPPVPQKPEQDAFEKSEWIKEEEFTRAVALGLFDYLRKSKSKGFTLSLSGGADSSACAALVAYMVLLAEESIGIQDLKEKLSYISDIQSLEKPSEILYHLLQTVYQRTVNSSDTTENSARSLAESLGAQFHSITIDGLVDQYTQLIESQIGRKLTWETDDLALQNIQARVRAPSIWLFTNLSGHLLLATSNRSEVAVGYCTMDGDTAGSISPIAGIDKHWLRHWLKWAETTGTEVKGRRIQLPGLQFVNQLAPTAELRPLEQNQTDEADLMPYACLQSLEIWGIKNRKSPIGCYQMALASGLPYTPEQWQSWIPRFFRLWSRNQWKRERYAPGFHLDNHNLDPRSWCRFPILSGGFEKELQDFEDFLNGKKSIQRPRIGF